MIRSGRATPSRRWTISRTKLSSMPITHMILDFSGPKRRLEVYSSGGGASYEYGHGSAPGAAAIDSGGTGRGGGYGSNGGTRNEERRVGEEGRYRWSAC